MTIQDLTMRPATPADAEAICAIYNQGIEDRVATLETELRTPAERRDWLAARGARHPVVVACRGARVIGWGSLNVYKPREAYRHVADFSLYVERDCRGQGAGRRLLEHLIDTARSLGYHKLMLSTFPFNTKGVKLYERLGFERIGICRQMGMLDGAWVDTLLMEKLL